MAAVILVTTVVIAFFSILISGSYFYNHPFVSNAGSRSSPMPYNQGQGDLHEKKRTAITPDTDHSPPVEEVVVKQASKLVKTIPKEHVSPEEGGEEPALAPPLIIGLVHGLAGKKELKVLRNFEKLKGYLATHHPEVVVYEVPLGVTLDIGIEEQAEITNELLHRYVEKNYAGRRVHLGLIGHSGGGLAAGIAAAENPYNLNFVGVLTANTPWLSCPLLNNIDGFKWPFCYYLKKKVAHKSYQDIMKGSPLIKKLPTYLSQCTFPVWAVAGKTTWMNTFCHLPVVSWLLMKKGRKIIDMIESSDNDCWIPYQSCCKDFFASKPPPHKGKKKTHFSVNSPGK